MKLIAATLLTGSALLPAAEIPEPDEGQCVLVGVDTERADPTFSDPDGGDAEGATLFLSCGVTRTKQDVFILRLDAAQAERLVEIAELLADDG